MTEPTRAIPRRYRAAYLRRDEVGMFGDAPPGPDRDVRRSLHVGEVPMPEPAPDEVLVAVMAAGVNYNTVWSAMFEPVPTFAFLARYGRTSADAARHDTDRHVIGSDASGIVVAAGAAVRTWAPGDRVVISPAHIDAEDPDAQEDAMVSAGQRAWGFETNFGGLADYALVKATQLIRKPAHLTWEEAAVNTLCAATAYRMLAGRHGARMTQGDVVLVWGATGGLGGYAVQLVRNGGGIPVGVVGSPDKAALLRRMGCPYVVERAELGVEPDELASSVKAWRRLGEAIRRQVGEDPHIVFEYVGRETFGASVYVTRRGGTVVTCGSSSGYRHEYDNRYLWMNLKRIIGSHGANHREASDVNRLIGLGMLVPTLSRTYDLADVGEAVRAVQLNRHVGKVAVRCLAEADGLGVDDPELRARVGEERLGLFRTPE